MMARFGVLVVVALLSACVSPSPSAEGNDPALRSKVPLFEGMGDHRLEVTTPVPLARRYFDQGLALCHGFNHDAGAWSFEEAARLDPSFAMAYWGIAYALGPNYNLNDEGEAYAMRAIAALKVARSLKEGVSEKERGLIDAMSQRFGATHVADRTALNRAYYVAMAKLWQRYPQDGDIGALYAEAILQKNPWDQWTSEGLPKYDTPLAVATLERVLELNVNHPAANHLYIHTMEASQEADRAEPAADRLGALIPNAGHLVHMPSHIYMRVGRYDDSVRVNEAAAKIDRAFFEATNTTEVPSIYHGYHLHNHHFLVWSAMFQGRYEDALMGCEKLVANMPAVMRAMPEMADWFTTKLHVELRFGQWERVIASPQPPQAQSYAVAMWHYARGVAFANTERFEQARRESMAFERAAALVSKEMMIHVVPAHDVVEVARQMLAGELAFKEGRTKEAFVALRKAVKAENALRYTEPNPWMMPTRHALGALLLQEGEVMEAERHYRDDLRRYPENGWSLHGLAECLERQGRIEEAAAVKLRFDRAWSKATVVLPGSCFCRTK